MISGTLELAAIALFVWLLGGSVVRSQQEREPYEKFIGASIAWFAILGLWNFWIVWQMSWKRSVGIPALQDALWIHAAFFGFIANMIFGFSLRVLPHFLGLRESKTWAANVAFVLWNAVIFLRYPLERLAWAASVLEAVAIVLFVWALGVFARRRTRIEIRGVDNSFAWFVYLGYAWLLIAAAIPFHADVFRLSASSRHTMAIGFITSLIMGVSYRVLPIFNGVNLWSGRLMRVSFWHLAAGSTLALSMAFNECFRDNVELRVVGDGRGTRLCGPDDVRDQHRDDFAHQGREVHTGIDRQADDARDRVARNPSRHATGADSWRAGRSRGDAARPAALCYP